MKPTSGGFSEGGKQKTPRAGQTISYQNIAGGLADEMMGFIQPSEPRKCVPPFKMVIMDRRGSVVFECKVSRGGRVKPVGLVRGTGIPFSSDGVAYRQVFGDAHVPHRTDHAG